MKCYKCNEEILTVVQNESLCLCGHRQDGPLKDPAELLGLVEKAEGEQNHVLADLIHRDASERAKGHLIGILRGLEAVKSYLSGDPSALKKLGGEE